MAIPSVPSNYNLQTGNQKAFLSWDITPTATSYSVQRSTDGVTFSVLATPAINNYLDTTVVIGTQYYYQVAATNGSGTSAYTTAQSIVPTPIGEMSLGELRLKAQQRADRVNSQFVTLTEWDSYINQSMYELYDLLVTVYEDLFMAAPIQWPITGGQAQYPLPDGTLTFINGTTNSTFVAPAFYKLLGMDLALNTSNNAFVTVNRFNFIDRNNYVYPNSNSTIYGVFNLQYRVMGTNIQFIPTPTNGQVIQMWYIPRLPVLLKDTDITTIGFSGWLEYVIIRAAILALLKEESDVTMLAQSLGDLKGRIQSTAQSRDVGLPDTISNVRQNGNWGGSGSFGGFHGGM